MSTTIELEHNSQALKDFASKLSFVTFRDEGVFTQNDSVSTVFQHEDGRFFIASTDQDPDSMRRDRVKTQSGGYSFCAWHKEFDGKLPYIVTFIQVTRHERQVTEVYWESDGQEVH